MNQPPTIAKQDPVDTVIIGAGLAGLSCARRLHEAGRSFVICEAADRVGGRVVTDLCEGFRLDRGFQVLLTAYPEAQKQLDYASLHLRRFYPGALVRYGGGWHRVADPFRHPIDGLRGAFNPIGSFADKLRVGRLRLRGFDFSKHAPTLSALQALQAEGFSASLIERFFRPFLGGVFLENELSTTVKKLEFVMRFFAQGDTAVPALGMGEIPKQLVALLPASAIRLGARVSALAEDGVRLEGGEFLGARSIVIATELSAADRLLGNHPTPFPANSVSCLYFGAATVPIHEPIIMLNGEGHGPINNLSVISAVSPEYAPAGQHLISVSVVDRVAAAVPDLEAAVRQQLFEWFGSCVGAWRLLRIDRIAEAVPGQPVFERKSPRLRRGLYQCGDHCGLASLNTALASGVEAAEAIIEDFP